MNKLIVKKSLHADGYGLFTTVDIKKGDVIYIPHIIKIPKDIFLNLNIDPHSMKFILEKSWGEKNDILTPISIDQFVNHSIFPNCFNGIALKNINKDEEILEDYRQFDKESWFKELSVKYGAWTTPQ